MIHILKEELRWAADQMMMLTCKPSRFLKQADELNRQGWLARVIFITRFMIWPIALVFVVSVFTALVCLALHILFNWQTTFSWQTTFASLGLGIGTTLVVGFVIGARYGIEYAFAFAIPAGSLVGFPYAVFRTIPIPDRNHLTVALAGPGRTIAIALVTGALAGLLTHTIAAVLGKRTHALTFGVGMGTLYGAAMARCIDTQWGLGGGLALTILLTIGFSQRNSSLGSSIVGGAYGFALGLASGAHQPSLQVNKAFVALATTFAFWLFFFRYGLYPLHLLWAATTYRVAKNNKARAQAMWACFPLNVDETLRIPLPFTTEFLVLLGEQDAEFARNETLRVIAQRPIHRPDAGDALAQLLNTDLKADSLSQIIGAANKLKWVNGFVPVAQQQLNISFLKHFWDIARDCAAYYQLQNGNGDARWKLEEIRDSISQLNTSLAHADTPFLDSARRWSAIIEQEHRELLQRSSPSDFKVIEQPFVYGPSLAENHACFVGRTETAVTIENAILTLDKRLKPTRQPLLFYGPKRMGKTSLLHNLPRLVHRNIIRVVISFSNPLLRFDLSSHLRALIETTEKEIEARFKSPSSSLTPEFLSRNTWDGLSEVTITVISKWLSELEVSLPPEVCILWCLDEYEALRVEAQRNADKRAWIEEVLQFYRGLTTSRHFALLFTGSSVLADQGDFWVSFISYVSHVQLSFLDEDDVKTLLTNPVPDFPVSYDKEAVQEIIRQTHCQPFLVQAVASKLIEILNRQRTYRATLACVEAAIEESLSEGQVFFSVFYEAAEDDGRRIMNAVARGQNINMESKAFRWLVNNDILSDSGQFLIPMFARWVRQELNRRG